MLERGVHVKLMLSERAYTYKHRKEHLMALLELNSNGGPKLVQVKVFHVCMFISIYPFSLGEFGKIVLHWVVLEVF